MNSLIDDMIKALRNSGLLLSEPEVRSVLTKVWKESKINNAYEDLTIMALHQRNEIYSLGGPMSRATFDKTYLGGITSYEISLARREGIAIDGVRTGAKPRHIKSKKEVRERIINSALKNSRLLE